MRTAAGTRSWHPAAVMQAHQPGWRRCVGCRAGWLVRLVAAAAAVGSWRVSGSSLCGRATCRQAEEEAAQGSIGHQQLKLRQKISRGGRCMLGKATAEAAARSNQRVSCLLGASQLPLRCLPGCRRQATLCGQAQGRAAESWLVGRPRRRGSPRATFRGGGSACLPAGGLPAPPTRPPTSGRRAAARPA